MIANTGEENSHHGCFWVDDTGIGRVLSLLSGPASVHPVGRVCPRVKSVLRKQRGGMESQGLRESFQGLDPVLPEASGLALFCEPTNSLFWVGFLAFVIASVLTYLEENSNIIYLSLPSNVWMSSITSNEKFTQIWLGLFQWQEAPYPPRSLSHCWAFTTMKVFLN